MPSDNVLQLCNSSETVISALAAQQDQPVSKVIKGLFKKHGDGALNEKNASIDSLKGSSELDRAAQCGKFPYRPSDLFLQIYNDVLGTLDEDSLAGLVSPSLLGSSGVIPLSVVSVIPDIMRHYADLIVRAQTEVFIATNYWEPSHSARIVTDSIRELSKRVKDSNREKVVVKLMYDRGSPKQVLKNHILVNPEDWPKVGLPKPEDIPGVALEVVNYHRPPLGTFHAKYLVVDRKVACLNSNNIQDRPNVEMMIHLEGPIVESFYDMALLSWSNSMNPPLPLLSKSPTYPGVYQFKKENDYLKYIDPDLSSQATREFLKKQHALNEEEAAQGQEHTDSGTRTDDRVKRALNADGEGDTNDENHLLDKEDSNDNQYDRGRSQLISQHPNMTVPHGSQSELERSQQQPSNDDKESEKDATDYHGYNPVAADRALNDEDGELATKARQDDVGISRSRESGSVAKVAEHLNAGNIELDATAEDDDTMLEFRPHILHEPHQPCPIAMVNRNPTGTPGHDHVHKVPQDVAWLGAMKYAQQSVFVQTPTFNASAIVPATLDACRRGVQVTLYLDLGFNDQGEMIPFQGGTNEEVVNKMYKTLNEEGKQKNLRVYWYTGKDQRKPLSAAMKKRNCHVKFMSIDDQVAILGNGNQDTQSWFHSQEINVMVDSRELVAEWHKGINANQNTIKYGLVSDEDGVWRDENGVVVEASGIKTAGLLGRLKGLGGAVARVRGTGGF